MAEFNGAIWHEKAKGPAHQRQIAYSKQAQVGLDAAGVPQLVEALEHMIQDCNLVDPGPYGHDSVKRKWKRLQNARAVAAKARGGEQV